MKPPARVNIKQLQAAAGLSRAAIYRWIASGKLPRPIQVGAGVFWEVKTVREALARQRRLFIG